MEQAQVALATTPVRKAAVLAELADKRVEELVYVAEKGDAGQVEAVSKQLNSHLETVATLTEASGRGERTAKPPDSPPGQGASPASPAPAPGREALKKRMEEQAVVNEERLNKALDKAPASVKPALAKSVEQTKAAYDKALKSVSKEPPGQAKKGDQPGK